MAERWDGRVVLVTGGATGIGAACVERFARGGARVACCYNRSGGDAARLVETLGAAGGTVHALRMDVLSEDAVRQGVEEVVRRFDAPVAVLVNNAGDVFDQAPLTAMPVEAWNRMLALNLTGALLCARHCAPGMQRLGWGRIVNLSSISARSGGGPGAAHYAAAKAGLESLTRSLARELAPRGITVNAVAPGVIDTPMHQRISTPASLETLRQRIPLQRLGRAEEVAGVVAFLASEDAAYVTGTVVAVNGGMRMD